MRHGGSMTGSMWRFASLRCEGYAISPEALKSFWKEAGASNSYHMRHLAVSDKIASTFSHNHFAALSISASTHKFMASKAIVIEISMTLSYDFRS